VSNIVKLFLLLGALFLVSLAASTDAKADIVTEFGGGYKFNSSVVLAPECQVIHIHEDQPIRANPSSPYWGRSNASCGGDNPAFIGWPIAWQSKPNGKHGAFTYRIGWFHYSNWFDGGELSSWTSTGDEHETHMNLLAGTITFNWTTWRKGKHEFESLRLRMHKVREH